MKNYLIIAASLGALLYACARMAQPQVGSSPLPVPNCFCADTSRCNTLCSLLPIDVNEDVSRVGYDSDLDPVKQTPFDIFSWQTFIALNWPAGPDGHPLSVGLQDSTGVFRVWEYYTDPAEIFEGSTQAGLLTHLTGTRAAQRKFFYMDSKSPNLSIDLHGFREADGKPLIDRNLNFAVYEVKVNPDETNYLRRNKLTTLDGIYDYYLSHNGQGLEFPASNYPDTIGSMEVKAAWRILDPSKGDDPSRYYTREAVIYLSPEKTKSGKADTIHATVGLVGMHIIRKTKQLNGFLIWTTFEHIDNTPDNPQAAQDSQDTTRRWSFYNPACLTCPVNTAPKSGPNNQYLWNDKPPYALDYATSIPSEHNGQKFGTQVTRSYPIYFTTQQVNAVWQEKLKGTVWANYRLIGTQWALAESFPMPIAPNALGNTTLETYLQVDASCIGCHQGASVQKITPAKDTVRIPTDMSFIFLGLK
ncbi:MAG: hypothetical protein JNL02_01250 [Saprospiraceae bacterium]|nr:hypothetical protein [Saprospiraceae bacterium]